MTLRRALRLTLPSEPAALPCGLALVREVAAQAGFPPEDAQRLELAVEEAVQNVLQHAFAPGEEAEFTVSCEPEPMGLAVAIRDQGMPFDPEGLAPDPGPDGKGLGMRLMRGLVDRVELRNLGPSGKETRLFKLLPSPLAVLEEGEEGTADLSPGDEPASGGWNHTLRWATPEDAVGICQCLYEAYGFTYFREDLYYPDRLRALHISGEMRSAVAVTPRGEVNAHAAMILDPERPGVADLGVAAVRTRAQGGTATLKLLRMLGEEGRRMGLDALFSECVTAHPRSQRLALALGLRDCGFQLGWIGAGQSFRSVAALAGDRHSLVVSCAALSEKPLPPLYPSASGGALVARILEHLGRPHELVPQGDVAPRGETTLHVTMEPRQQRVGLRIFHVGEDLRERLRREQYRMKREGLVVALAELPLAVPEAAVAWEILEAAGFFFTGLLPGQGGEDVALFQYLNGILIDYGRIQLASEFARELLGEVRQRQLASIR